MIIFAKWRSHNGQLIFNESVTHEAKCGIAISNWQPQLPKVVTSLSCSPYTSHPSLCKSRSTAQPDVMKRPIAGEVFYFFALRIHKLSSRLCTYVCTYIRDANLRRPPALFYREPFWELQGIMCTGRAWSWGLWSSHAGTLTLFISIISF